MPVSLSNTDAILFAIPMLVFIVLWIFRVDQIVSRPKTIAERGHQLSNWAEDGEPICVQPDGKLHRQRPAGPRA
jgi:hypothetical protein